MRCKGEGSVRAANRMRLMKVDDETTLNFHPVNSGWVFLSHKGFQFACEKCEDKMRREEDKKARKALAEMNSGMPNNCHHCGRMCRGRPRCKYCQSKAYCSDECKSADWEIHQLFCENIQDAAAGGEMGRKISKREIEKKAEEMATKEYYEAVQKKVSSIQL